MLNIKLLKHLLEGKGAKADVIRKTGISRPTIDAILSGGDPRVSTLVKIADALDIPVASILNNEDTVAIRQAGRDYHEHRDSVEGNKTITIHDDEIKHLKDTIEQLKARLADKDVIIELLKQSQK